MFRKEEAIINFETDVCMDCGMPVYDIPYWSLDIVLCRDCWIERKREDE